jgi:hypothetical protein
MAVSRFEDFRDYPQFHFGSTDVMGKGKGRVVPTLN